MNGVEKSSMVSGTYPPT